MKSYLKFLSRNKLYAIIEAFGLAFALGQGWHAANANPVNSIKNE